MDEAEKSIVGWIFIACYSIYVTYLIKFTIFTYSCVECDTQSTASLTFVANSQTIVSCVMISNGYRGNAVQSIYAW